MIQYPASTGDTVERYYQREIEAVDEERLSLTASAGQNEGEHYNRDMDDREYPAAYDGCCMSAHVVVLLNAVLTRLGLSASENPVGVQYMVNL